jgi:hypothetical protein
VAHPPPLAVWMPCHVLIAVLLVNTVQSGVPP